MLHLNGPERTKVNLIAEQILTLGFDPDAEIVRDLESLRNNCRGY
jgi:hypothetical protein